MNSRTFHIGAVLSVTTGKLLCPDGTNGLYDILDHMMGDGVYTYQVADAANACKPHLIRQHPWLAKINADQVTADNWATFVGRLGQEHGVDLQVAPIAVARGVVAPLAVQPALTEQQMHVLRYLHTFLVTNHQMPTRAQAAKDFGWDSPNAAGEIMLRMEAAGALQRNELGNLMLSPAGMRLCVNADCRAKGATHASL